MNEFQRSLDRYLTTEPEDRFTPWVEDVYNAYGEDFYKMAYGDSDKAIPHFEDSTVENGWLNKLYDKGYSPEQAAKVIERAYSMYKTKSFHQPELK